MGDEADRLVDWYSRPARIPRLVRRQRPPIVPLQRLTTPEDSGIVPLMTSNELPEIWGQTFKARTKNGEHGDECISCGRRSKRNRGTLGSGLFVRVDASLSVPIRWDDPRKEDGGVFPVGTECAKKFPAGYVGEMDEYEG